MATIAEQRESTAARRMSADVERSFPGNLVTGICMLAGPAVLIVATLLGMDTYHAKGIDYVHAMGEHSGRTALTFDLVVAGMILLLIAVIGLAQQITVERPRLGQAGGLITVIGILGPIFFNGVYFGGFQLAGGSHEAAAGYLIDHAQIIPSNVINISGPALIIGFILLAVGARRAGVLGRWSAIALGVTCIIPAGFISGFLVIATVGFVGAAISLIPLGLRLFRTDAEAVPQS